MSKNFHYSIKINKLKSDLRLSKNISKHFNNMEKEYKRAIIKIINLDNLLDNYLYIYHFHTKKKTICTRAPFLAKFSD